MTVEREILHVDMDAFYASVEQHDHPELRGRPVVVGAPADKRGVVAAASYEARKFGIHSAMPSREAYRRCPDAVFVPVNGARYRDVSRQVFAIFERFTPHVEPLSIDEAFLDVTGARRMFGTGEEIGRQIREAVLREVGLTCSVGVASNKFLAKLASELDKPDGMTVVPRGRSEVIAFLAPLPVRALWGVGKVTSQALELKHVRSVGDLQAISEAQLARWLGRHAAAHLRRLAFGEDERDVETDVEEKSISHEYTYPEDCDDPAELERCLCELTERVGIRLRAANRYAGVIRLKLRWHDFRTITRQRALSAPSCDDITLRKVALALLREQRMEGRVRLLGIGVGKLSETRQQQLSLFDTATDQHARSERLSRAADEIRRQFGEDSVGSGGRGISLGSRPSEED